MCVCERERGGGESKKINYIALLRRLIIPGTIEQNFKICFFAVVVVVVVVVVVAVEVTLFHIYRSTNFYFFFHEQS